MKLTSLTLLVLLATGSAALHAQLPCREDAYGNYICDGRSDDPDMYPDEDGQVQTGIPSGIPGVPTHRPTLRQAQPAADGRPAAPILGGADPDDSGPVYEVTEDGLGNYRARTGDGRVLHGATDAYGELVWRDQLGNPVDCAFDQTGRLACE